MVKGLYFAAKSLQDKIRNIQIVANNLANINTTGFKREIPFAEYLDRAENKAYKQITDFTEGSLVETGNPFDLAITGKGFFLVKTERGFEITKNGRFKIDEEGFLTTEDGERVQGKNGEISFLENIFEKNKPITIAKDGIIKVGDEVVNQLKIVEVENTNSLIRTENGKYYLATEDYIKSPEQNYSVHQGYLEESNTNPILEMQAMIKLEKDYEASQKMIASLDQMMGQAKEIGRVS